MPRHARHREYTLTTITFTVNTSTRELRSHLKNPKGGAKRKLDFDRLGEDGSPRQRPKRPRQPTVLYHCLSCIADMPSRGFPDHNPSPECEHLINTCKKSLKGRADAQIDRSLAVTLMRTTTVLRHYKHKLVSGTVVGRIIYSVLAEIQTQYLDTEAF